MAQSQCHCLGCAGYTHTATLTKLQPSRQYYYIYGDALLREFSSEHSFRTTPAVGSDATLHLLVNADMVRTLLCQTDESPEATEGSRPGCTSARSRSFGLPSQKHRAH